MRDCAKLNAAFGWAIAQRSLPYCTALLYVVSVAVLLFSKILGLRLMQSAPSGKWFSFPNQTRQAGVAGYKNKSCASDF